MLLKHDGKTLGHAVVIFLAMLAYPAMSKDFGILTRMLYAAWPSALPETRPLPATPAGQRATCTRIPSTSKRRSRLA